MINSVSLHNKKTNTVLFMQRKKENIRQIILHVSKDEFLMSGFKDASMRVITRRSGVSLSNIYNYFRNKDELFGELLQPLLQDMKKAINEHNNPENITPDYFTADRYQQEELKMIVGLLEQYHDELNLLLLKSDGSSFANYKHKIADRNTEMGLEYLQKMKEKYPHVNTDVSPFFAHTISAWWITILCEIVSQKLSHEELTQFMSEYIKYATAGWKKLMEI